MMFQKTSRGLKTPFPLRILSLAGKTIAQVCLCLLLAFLLPACSEDIPSPEKAKLNQTGYHFHNNAIGDSLSRDSLSRTEIALFDVIGRCQEKTTFHLLSQTWPKLQFAELLVARLKAFPSASASICIGNSKVEPFFSSSQLEAKKLLGSFSKQSEQLKIKVAEFEAPAQDKSNSKHHRKLKTNVLLTSKMAAKGRDNGNFSILFSNNSFDRIGLLQTAELIEIFGDSILYSSLLSYWNSINNSDYAFDSDETHVYSNLFDHKVWYLGNQSYTDPALEFTDQLETALKSSHQPAKIRIAISEWDNCRYSFTKRLTELQEKYELDLKVLIKDSTSSYAGVYRRLKEIPYQGCRVFPRHDSIQRIDFNSNFMLLQGPFSLHDDGDATASHIAYFFSEGLTNEASSPNKGLWLRISDQTIYEQSSNYWDQLWAFANDTLPTESSFYKRAKLCKN